MLSMRKLLALMFCAILSSCAGAKQIVRTVHDAAVVLCEVFAAEQAEKQGITVEQSVDAFCSSEEKLRPFIEAVLVAKQTAGAQTTGAR